MTIADLLDAAENGFITQSRLILLDSPLVFFTALTALSFTCFTNKQEQGPSHAFTVLWWFWLAATGLCLGATLSVKWVGLFTIAWVGSLTVLQLWVLLGDAKNVTPVRTTLVHGIEIEKLTIVLASLVQTFLGSGFLLDSFAHWLLLRNVCYSLFVSGEPG